MIFEYNKLYDNVVGNPASWHPNVWNTIGNDVNVIFRYNEVWNYMVEGIMMSTSSPDSNWYIYGNLWHNTLAFNVSRVVEAQYTTQGPVYMYNNTFVDIARIVTGGNGAWAWDSRCASSNNIFFNCGADASGGGHGFFKGHDDYDLSDVANPEPHGIGGATSAIFMNYAGGNYHIVTNIASTFPRNKGAALGSTYAVDMDGNVRGADGVWDIGGFEYSTGSPVNNDTTPPTVSLTSPTIGVTVSNLVTLTASASDNVGGSGMASVTFTVDGSSVGTASSGPYTINWNSTSLGNGSHNVQAVAADFAGNQATSAVVNITIANVVDSTPPSVILTAPANSDIVSNTVTLTATASDTGGSGMSSVTFLVDGSAAGTVSNSPYSMNWNSRGVANGTHSIQARAQDVAGNQATTTAINVTVQNSIVTISNGFVGYWTFNDASGTTAADSSGSGNNGTLVGDATWGTGVLGGCLSLSGGTGYVRVPSSASLEQVSTGVTICAWVKLGTNIAYAQGDMQSIARKVISETSNPTPYASYDFVVQDAGNGTFQPRMAVTRASDSTRGIVWGSPHTYGSWYHFAGVYDGTTVRIYVNGAEEANTPFSGALLSTAGQPLCIGRFGTVGEAVNGLIDDFRVYNRALTATEIQSFYNTAVPPAPFGLKIVPN